MICLVAWASVLCAQDIESIAKGDLLKGSGGISFNQIYYNAYGKSPSRLPYSYLFTGNLNLKLLGFIDAPFNFMYSNLGNRSSQPTFNQTSIHPSYKWFTVHIGSVSCNYSPYTVNGYLFKGMAVDMTPGKISFSAFYGRLQKVVRPDEVLGNPNAIPVYKRMGAGCKIGLRDDRSGILELIVFGAKDQINSLPVMVVPESNAPKQNWNSGLRIQKKLLKKISFSGDMAFSMMTEDLRISERNTALPTLFRFANTNSSTAIYKALKSCLAYQLGKGNVNIAYERVDPFYRTMGAYYFNNDLENITAGITASMFRQRVNFTANGGVQHDNLQKKRLSTMNRFVCNSNLSIRPGRKVNINLNYSNFLSYTNVRSTVHCQNQLNPYQQWDTLNFRQISRCVTANMMLVLKADSLAAMNLTGTMTFQNAADKQGGEIRNGTAFLNANLGYSFLRIKTGESIVISCNVGQSAVSEKNLFNVCPLINISKPFFNQKLKPGISLSYTNSYYDKKYSGAVLNVRGALNYTVQKVHNFAFTFLILNRKDSPVTSLYTPKRRFTESTFSLTYSVNMEFFDTKKWWTEKKK